MPAWEKAREFNRAVIGFLSGELGDPPGGWPEPFRSKALQGRTVPSNGDPISIELDEDETSQLLSLGLPVIAGACGTTRSTVGSMVVAPASSM